VRKKIRDAELAAGTPRLPNRHLGQRVSSTPAERDAEQQLAAHAEPPTSASAPTGPPVGRRRRAPARHQGAHLKSRQRGKQRGRPKPQSLRFSSSVTGAHNDSATRSPQQHTT